MDPDLDPVQGIDRVFSESSNIEPRTSRLRTQMRFVTPLSFDLKHDITKPTSRKIIVSADLNSDLSDILYSGQPFYKSVQNIYIPLQHS